MFAHRKDDTLEYKKRSGRFYQKNGKEWYLQTREGIELGPFQSHAEAAVCLNDYLEFINDKTTDENDLKQFYKIFAAA